MDLKQQPEEIWKMSGEIQLFTIFEIEFVNEGTGQMVTLATTCGSYKELGKYLADSTHPHRLIQLSKVNRLHSSISLMNATLTILLVILIVLVILLILLFQWDEVLNSVILLRSWIMQNLNKS